MLKLRENKLLLLFLISVLIGCSSKKDTSNKTSCPSLTSPCLNGKVVIQMSTNRGIIKIELNGEAAPLTAGNFLDLINKGVYNKTTFHRVIKEPSPFVVIGGDPLSKDKTISGSEYGKGNFIDPKTGQIRFIPLEIKLENERKPRYNQLIKNPNETNKIIMTHQRGSVAMARGKNQDTASSQFYISLRPLPELDGRYAVFGRVIRGLEVIDAIEQDDKVLGTKFSMSTNK